MDPKVYIKYADELFRTIEDKLEEFEEEISHPEIPARVNVPINSKDRIRFALLTVTDQSE